MKLLIDIGNSKIKWATVKENQFKFGNAEVYDVQSLGELLCTLWKDLETPELIIIANVGGQTVRDKITAWIKDHWSTQAEFVVPAVNAMGVTNAYSDPQKLGVDRWVNLIAAKKSYHSPVAIISCGTGITVDAMTADGQHQGGVIAPGINLMRLSLLGHTAGCFLPKGYERKQSSWLGKRTEDGIISGSLIMAGAFINQCTERLFWEFGKKLHCVITGGDAEVLLPMLKAQYDYRPYLVLEGLAALVKS